MKFLPTKSGVPGQVQIQEMSLISWATYERRWRSWRNKRRFWTGTRHGFSKASAMSQRISTIISILHCSNQSRLVFTVTSVLWYFIFLYGLVMYCAHVSRWQWLFYWCSILKLANESLTKL
jgi:hypothetical protein